MGLVMGTTTPLVMSAVEEDKSAVGAAVNNTLRQIGAAFGVAIIGSVYSVAYRADLGSSLHGLGLPAQASDSLGGTVVALQGVPGAASVLAPARDAFVASMHTTVLVAVGVLAAGAVLARLWLPGPSRAEADAHAHAAAPTVLNGREAVER
jgi:hypothetical protein